MKKKILIVVADYYKNISSGLISSAKKEIQNSLSISIKHVPGVFEIPVTISKNINKFNGFIALGCIIKGETDHDVYISHAVANGLIKVSIKNNKPVIFGVLTTNNLNQALERCGGKHGDKGLESAQSLLQLISNFKD